MTAQLAAGAAVAIVLAFVLTLVDAALTSTSRVAAEEAEDEGRAGAGALRRVLDDVPAHASVIAFVRAVTEGAAAVFVTLGIAEATEGTVRPLITTIVVMAIIGFVLVGVSPRTLGRQHSTAIVLAAAPVIVWLRRLLGPFARLLVALGNAVTPGTGYRDGPFRTEAELRDLLDLAGENELIEDDERDMLHSVFELGDTRASEVMVPRTDMITVDADLPLRKAVNLFIRSGYSRIPVIGDSTDDVRGLLYLKDAIKRVIATPEGTDTEVARLMRPAPFVPESKPVDQLLREMQRDQIHAAIVVDEYGGTAGLVTIEDVLEEIVGEITDEYDRDGPGMEDLGEGRWRVPAGLHVDDLAEHFGADLEEDEVDTVGGLIGKTTGRVPIVGSTCEIAGLRLTAERMGGRRHRIATVLVEPVGAISPAQHGSTAMTRTDDAQESLA